MTLHDPQSAIRNRLRTLIVPISLYIVVAALLLFHIGDHPPWVYNWENYTASGLFGFWDHPTVDVFRLNEGLMTDSNKAALTILPAWLGFSLGGVGLESMRVPFALIAAGAAPLLWLLARRMFGHAIALLSAILLALSPVYLLYGRTATIVGLSLVPALLTMYALVHVLKQPRSWGWLIALQALLLLNSYAYAPIRFLWPLSLMLFLAEWLWRHEERRALLVALVVTALVLPALLLIIPSKRYAGPLDTLAEYYGGRGEQVGALASRPDEYAYYLELTPEERAEGKPTGTPLELALRLISLNARNYVWLLADWNTRPALTDHWNPRGRLYPALLVPFFLLGIGYAAWRARRRVGLEYRVLLALFFGFGLPLLLTSRVHIGRLIYALPLLMILVSLGYMWVMGWFVRRVGSWLYSRSGESSAAPEWRRYASAAFTLSLVACVAWLTWFDFSPNPPVGRERLTVLALQSDVQEAKESGGVAFVQNRTLANPFEVVNTLPYKLDLDTLYRFVNLAQSGGHVFQPAPQDPRPPIYLGGVMARLDKPETMPNYCHNLYYVDPDVELQFLDAMKQRASLCTNELKYRLLP
jgi:4-amino-4-deoxy-L-arabinose transferase-like glycosyltransferase